VVYFHASGFSAFSMRSMQRRVRCWRAY
jgi:hypothetical protein